MAAGDKAARFRAEHSHALGDVLRRDIIARRPAWAVVAQFDRRFEVGQRGNGPGTDRIDRHPVRPGRVPRQVQRPAARLLAGVIGIGRRTLVGMLGDSDQPAPFPD